MSRIEGQKPVSFFEIRCKELQEEIDELHKLIKTEHGEEGVVANYIEQVKRHEKLILDRNK